MADPQQYTDAQLSDGTTLRFLGTLGPDEVRQKVQAFRARQAPTQNIPFGQGMTAKQDLASMPGRPNPQSVQPSMLGQALNPNPNGGAAAIANPQQPAEQFALQNPEQQDTLAGASAVGAAGVASPLALPFLNKARAWVGANPLKSYMAIQALKASPAGPYVNKIPGIEMLPWLMSEGKAGASERARTKLGVPAPEAPPEPAPAQATPKATPEPVTEQPSASSAQLPFLRGQSQWPPPEPTGVYDQPVKATSGLADARDDEAIQEGIQDRIAQGERKANMQQSRRDWAANTVNRTKGDMQQAAKQATGPASTPGGTPATGDLTADWKKNLEYLKAQKGKR